MSTPPLGGSVLLMRRRLGRDEDERLRESYDLIWRERTELLEQTAALKAELDEERASRERMERRLRNTLVFAEDAAGKLKERTRAESELALKKSRERSEAMVVEAERRRAELELEARLLEKLLAERARAADEAAERVRAEAESESERIVRLARGRADEIAELAERERERLEQEIERTRDGYREFLAALEQVARHDPDAKREGPLPLPFAHLAD